MTDDPLYTPFARDYAVRDYKSYLKTERQAKPTSVNLALAAIDHFHQFIGNDRPQVQRESLPAQAPRALKPEEQKAFLRAVERASTVRDRALAQILFYTAIRLGECAALNLDDVRVSARKGIVIIRSGKGDAYREVPLNAEVREVLRLWLKERNKRFPQTSDPAVFLNPKGKRLSARSIDLIIRRIGVDAHLELSAHVCGAIVFPPQKTDKKQWKASEWISESWLTEARQSSSKKGIQGHHLDQKACSECLPPYVQPVGGGNCRH